MIPPPKMAPLSVAQPAATPVLAIPSLTRKWSTLNKVSIWWSDLRPLTSIHNYMDYTDDM